MCTYTANVIEKSEAKGEAKLVEAIRAYRANTPYDKLVDRYGEATAKLAKELV